MEMMSSLGYSQWYPLTVALSSWDEGTEIEPAVQVDPATPPRRATARRV